MEDGKEPTVGTNSYINVTDLPIFFTTFHVEQLENDGRNGWGTRGRSGGPGNPEHSGALKRYPIDLQYIPLGLIPDRHPCSINTQIVDLNIFESQPINTHKQPKNMDPTALYTTCQLTSANENDHSECPEAGPQHTKIVLEQQLIDKNKRGWRRIALNFTPS